MADARIPVYYTFGNHQHWVDFHWLWGYYVMPDALDDMRVFCDATGAKGCVNFDALGYEKMAFESPEALQALRQDVASGRFEIVGGSYGQPYGLFHGGESNIRHMVYGVRAAMRTLGVQVRTFWEEEFDFFPQLPQVLRGVGVDKASLYFQWTWHTPEVPREAEPVVWWQGLDGSRVLSVTRNRLNLHQWPEDFQILLDELVDFGPEEVLRRGEGVTPADPAPEGMKQAPITPLILQWLELMPSPDWMCRSELMIPKMQELMNDSRFEVKHATLGEYLEAVKAERSEFPVRQYGMADVWHGMSLGKNGDFMRRKARQCESELLSAETLASMMGAFGRPYPQWDVYPTWELEEGWRELLTGQHHDNEECERLCGYVGEYSYDRSFSLSNHVLTNNLELLAKRVEAPKGAVVAYNPLGWERDGIVSDDEGRDLVARNVPAFGYVAVQPGGDTAIRAGWVLTEDKAVGKLGETLVEVDLRKAAIDQICTKEFPDGLLKEGRPLLELVQTVDGKPMRLGDPEKAAWTAAVTPNADLSLESPEGVVLTIGIDPMSHAVDLQVAVMNQPEPDGGMNPGLQTRFDLNVPGAKLVADQPLSVTEVTPVAKGLKKYPGGDWMTSKQWFEEVHNVFTALTLVDLDAGERGALIVHDGSQQWFQDENGLRNLLSSYDPWDEAFYRNSFVANFRILTHGRVERAVLWRAAQEFLRPLEAETKKSESGDVPATFCLATCDAPNVCMTALHRETEHDGKRLGNYAGAGVGHPYVMRLVEYSGLAAEATVTLPGPVAKACRTNLMGAVEAELTPTREGERSVLRFPVRPYEVVTLVFDLVIGRKRFRDLDAHRDVWATVHRVDDK